MSNLSGAAAATVPPVPGPFDDGAAAAAAPQHAPRRALKFGEALAQLERHRAALRATLLIALAARLLLDFQFLTLARTRVALTDRAPAIALAALAYVVVLWFLATRTRDRFCFGMALGIGVLEVTHRVVALVMPGPLSFDAAWPLAVVAVAHVPMLVTAFHASTVFPPHDGKRPWIAGFVTAVALVALAWASPALLELAHR